MGTGIRYLVRRAGVAAVVVSIPLACGAGGNTVDTSGSSSGSTSSGNSVGNGRTTSGSGSSTSSGATTGSSGGNSGSTASSSGGTGTGSGGTTGGPWAGLSVSGTGFVDGKGAEFIPRGIGLGEWHNIESYMLNINMPSGDNPGMGETELRNALTAAIGQAGADQFFTTWEANLITAADVAEWASWGVNSIRLPMNYHALSSADGTYIEAGFQVLDQFIGWCKANSIYVILDLHAAPGAQNCEEMSDTPDGIAHLWTEPQTYRQWTIDLWQTVAKRYANETGVGGYDIFDEPYDTESSGDFSTGIGTLRQMYLDITTAIRAVDTNHVIFFEGTNWSSIDTSGNNGFSGLEPAWDPQMAWAFHKYWDGNTTADIQGYLDLRTSTNRPVWNGETGEDNTTGWSGQMIALLEANKIGWNEWTYKKVDNNADFYSINSPANWSTVTSYLENGGSVPANMSTIVMDLAANAATNQCVLQTAWLKMIFNK
jgi:endoglucanase